MNNQAIEFRNVTKCYLKQRLRYGMVSESIVALAQSTLNRQSGINKNLIVALDSVSFTVKKGETLGIIGPNGAGKSTILKLISKVTVPDLGTVNSVGRIGALIELGAGLHPELTGRENIRLYGAILGMKRLEVEAKFDDIVSFAEIFDFLDMPIKKYSSGMYARLGFAVAVNLDPEILLIDEVLAVGDEHFQQKCFNKMRQLKRQETTVVFISHNLDWIKRMCDRVIWLDGGKVKGQGSPSTMVHLYLQSV